MQYIGKMARHWAAGLLLVTSLGVMLVATRPVAADEDDHGIIARGGGTTIIHGGTGPPGFVPVLTTLAFQAERSAAGVSGTFECLALAPEAGTGKGSGQFTVNVMYVIGQITGATVSGDTATLTGTSSITGLGADTGVPFTFVVRRGGPGATAVLTVNTLAFSFHEVLVQGSFHVESSPKEPTAARDENK